MAILAFVNISMMTSSNTYQNIQNEPKNIFFGPELNDDTANFIKFIKIGCISFNFWSFWMLLDLF